MNKSDLIFALSKRENLSEKASGEIVNHIFHIFAEELKRGGRIEIRGLGSFVVRKYDSYTGRNPKSGEKIAVSPKVLPFFKPGKELREKVDG
jgi:integration host factor subunit beta